MATRIDSSKHFQETLHFKVLTKRNFFMYSSYFCFSWQKRQEKYPKQQDEPTSEIGPGTDPGWSCGSWPCAGVWRIRLLKWTDRLFISRALSPCLTGERAWERGIPDDLRVVALRIGDHAHEEGSGMKWVNVSSFRTLSRSSDHYVWEWIDSAWLPYLWLLKLLEF